MTEPTPCLILYRDQSDDIEFSGGSWDTDAPLTNLQDPRPSLMARSVDVTAASTKFFVEFSSAITLAAMVLVGTNFDVAGTYRITAYSDQAHTLPTFTTGLQPVWTASGAIEDWDLKGLDVVALFGQSVSARYWQIEMINTANVNGYLALSRLHCGTELALTHNMAVGSSFKRDANTTVTRALGGTPYFNKHRNIRTWAIGLPPESVDVAWDEIDRMVESCGIDRFVYVVAFPDDTDRTYKQSFLGTLDQAQDLSFIAGNYVSTGFQIVEYVG